MRGEISLASLLTNIYNCRTTSHYFGRPMKYIIWASYGDYGLEFIPKLENEEKPKGAYKICKAYKSDLKDLINFFKRQYEENHYTPQEIRARYYDDIKNPTEYELLKDEVIV